MDDVRTCPCCGYCATCGRSDDLMGKSVYNPIPCHTNPCISPVHPYKVIYSTDSGANPITVGRSTFTKYPVANTAAANPITTSYVMMDT